MTKIAVDTGVMGSLAASIATAAEAVADLGSHLGRLGVRAADLTGPSAALGESLAAMIRAWGPVAVSCQDDLARLHDAVVAAADVWDEIEALSPAGRDS